MRDVAKVAFWHVGDNRKIACDVSSGFGSGLDYSAIVKLIGGGTS